MLFHVTHTHTWETCPYHDPDRAQETFGAAMSGLDEAGVTLVGAWFDAPAHTAMLVIDADSAVAIEQALAPVIDVGWAVTRPVVDSADILKRVAESG